MYLKSKPLSVFLLLVCFLQADRLAQAADKPNIVYLMLDEWGYFESSGLGHERLQTPNIDQFAKQGIRLTQCLAGASVCGPTRSVLMTGQHQGRTTVRGNNGFAPLRADDVTVATLLKKAGYATGGFGKWGVGGRGSTGVPENHGFDLFFGYYHQVQAHSFFPPYLIRNSEEVVLPGNQSGDYYDGKTYADHEIYKEAIKFILQNKEQPFFCYLPWTPPQAGRPRLRRHAYSYAVRMKNWKLLKNRGKLELYDLDRDLIEGSNVADQHPAIVRRMQAFAKAAHTPARLGTFSREDLNRKDAGAAGKKADAIKNQD